MCCSACHGWFEFPCRPLRCLLGNRLRGTVSFPRLLPGKNSALGSLPVVLARGKMPSQQLSIWPAISCSCHRLLAQFESGSTTSRPTPILPHSQHVCLPHPEDGAGQLLHLTAHTEKHDFTRLGFLGCYSLLDFIFYFF